MISFPQPVGQAETLSEECGDTFANLSGGTTLVSCTFSYTYDPLIASGTFSSDGSSAISVEIRDAVDGSLLVSCEATTSVGSASCQDHGVIDGLPLGRLLTWEITVQSLSEGSGEYKCSTGKGAFQVSVDPADETYLMVSVLPSDVPDGEYEPTVVEQGWSALDGTKVLSIPPDAELVAEAEANGGYLNLLLTGFREGYFGQQAITATLVDHLAGPAFFLNEQVLSVPPFDFIPDDDGSCYWVTTKLDEQLARTVAGEYHVDRDVDGYFRYGTRGDSEIDMGTSADGQTWAISGSVHVGNSVESEITMNRGPLFHHEMEVDMKYVKEREQLYCLGFRVGEPNYLVRGTKFMPPGSGDGLEAIQPLATGENEQCMGPDQEYRKNVGENRYYSSAVTVFGATLGAKSGWSDHVEEYWKTGTTYQDSSHYCFYGFDAYPNDADVVYQITYL